MNPLTNEPQHILTIGNRKVYAAKLPSHEGVRWAERGNDAKLAVGSAKDYRTMGEAVEAVTVVLEAYPGLTDGQKEPLTPDTLSGASTQQLLDLLDHLLEANDPFVRVRQAREAQEEKGMRMLASLPPDQVGAVLRACMKADDPTLDPAA